MSGPHAGQPVRTAGPPVDRARAFVVLVHGRGGSATGMLGLAAEFDRPDVAYAAPQAAGSSWYPQRFLAPIEQNEPGLSSGLAVLDGLLGDARAAGLDTTHQLVVGFSQGACLALEYAVRHPRRYGGVAGLTGALIGPRVSHEPRPGSFDGAPVFLGSSDPHPHVPWDRVAETARVFERMDAAVDLRRYPGRAHTVNREEIEAVRGMIDAALR